MIKHTLIISALASALILSSGNSFSSDPKQVYGSQLMTQQERLEFHTRLRNAKTQEEREQIRNEHHKRMQERAKAQGKTLPDEPPVRGGESGKRMWPGGGMGPGGGRNR